MKYFIIAGEASGDLHGSRLILALKQHDPQATFQFLGGDEMAHAAGCMPIIHYRDMAYMGFVEVVKHLGSILGFMGTARRAMQEQCPDALILIDYPSFNLRMAKWAKGQGIPVFYFISPKVWVWKEWRVKSIKRYVSRMFSILPFETAFYAKHDYRVDYVGNPTVKEIADARQQFATWEQFAAQQGLDASRQLIALVPGSRRQEIAQNLPVMVQAAQGRGCQLAIAGAPSIDDELYRHVLQPLGIEVPVVKGHTFELVHHARVALVTSGTATLETALLRTPQVACYRMNGKKYIYRFYRCLLKGRYVTLPNLIADAPIIPELLLHYCTPVAIGGWLDALLPDSLERQKMLADYEHMAQLLTTHDCANETARGIVDALSDK